jgi:hypothetical protein
MPDLPAHRPFELSLSKPLRGRFDKLSANGLGVRRDERALMRPQ